MRKYLVSGQVLFGNQSAPKTIRRFVERKLQSWMEQNALRTPGSKPGYRVFFTRLGAGHNYLCEVEVVTDREIWRASLSSSGLHQAFLKALKSLIPNPSPTPPGGSIMGTMLLPQPSAA